jgi:hypothetical protein
VQIFDRKYRLFGVINLIDLLVVIALVVAGLVVWRLLWGGSSTAVPTAKLRDVEYTIVCTSIRDYSEGQIKVGDPVSTKTSGASIGTVASVSSNPTPGDIFNPNSGKVERYESTVASDVRVKVKAKGSPTPTGVSVGNSQIRNNGNIQMVTPTFQCDLAVATGLKIGGE